MAKNDFWIMVRNHLDVYVNLRHAGHSHAVYVRDNSLSDAIGDELRKIFIRILGGEALSDIRREVASRCRKTKHNSRTTKSR